MEMAAVMAAMSRRTTIEMAAVMASSAVTAAMVSRTTMASRTTIEFAAAMEVWWFQPATQEYWVDMLEYEEEGEVMADDDDHNNAVLLQLPPSLFAGLLTLCMMMHYNLVNIP